MSVAGEEFVKAMVDSANKAEGKPQTDQEIEKYGVLINYQDCVMFE